MRDQNGPQDEVENIENQQVVNEPVMNQCVADRLGRIEQSEQYEVFYDRKNRQLVIGVAVVIFVGANQQKGQGQNQDDSCQQRQKDSFRSIAYEVKQPFSIDHQFSKEPSKKKEKLHAEEMDEACKLEIEWISVVLARTPEIPRGRHKENANVDYQSQQHCGRAYKIQIVISSIRMRRLHGGRPERFWRLLEISPKIRRCR